MLKKLFYKLFREEHIFNIGRLAYVKLFDNDFKVSNPKVVIVEEKENKERIYLKLFWRLYWIEKEGV